MNKIFHIIGFLSLIGFSLCAQNEGLKLYEYPKTIPPSYKLFYQADSLILNDSIQQQLSKKEQKQYVCNYKGQLKYLAESGLVYFNWEAVDKYLNDLLFKITPDSLKNKLYSKVFVKKDVNYNAISMPNGHIYINVGLIANLKSEAALAFIIAHEYAHYLKKHHLKNFKQTFLGTAKNGSTYYRFMHTNKHLEIEADEIALKLLHEKNIPVKDAIDVFRLLKNNSKAYDLNSMRIFFVKKQVKQLLKQQQQPSPEFDEISLMCKNEFLNILLKKGDYLRCIKFGLSISDENNYNESTYFTAEAIRRYLLLKPGNANSGLDTLIAENTNQNSTSISDSISNNVLNKTILTYLEELLANNKLAEPELYFTSALYNLTFPEKEVEAKNDLQIYLQKENIKYALLASYLLNEEQLKTNENDIEKQVLLVDIVNNLEKASNKNKTDIDKQDNLNETVTDKLKQWLYARYSGFKIVFINDLVETEFNTANSLRDFFNVIDTSALVGLTQPVYYLKPGAFELFDSLETSSIRYIKIESKEDLKQRNHNVFNPLSLPSELKYLLKEKNTFSIKKVSLIIEEKVEIEEKEFNGKLKLNKITKAFEQILE